MDIVSFVVERLVLSPVTVTYITVQMNLVSTLLS
jgi:hypothetical protein